MSLEVWDVCVQIFFLLSKQICPRLNWNKQPTGPARFCSSIKDGRMWRPHTTQRPNQTCRTIYLWPIDQPLAELGKRVRWLNATSKKIKTKHNQHDLCRWQQNNSRHSQCPRKNNKGWLCACIGEERFFFFFFSRTTNKFHSPTERLLVFVHG